MVIETAFDGIPPKEDDVGEELIEELKQHCFPDSKIYKIVLRTMENRVNYLKATLEKSFSKNLVIHIK